MTRSGLPGAATTMPTRSLQTRIVALFLALTLVVQIGGFLLVDSVGASTARESIAENLAAGARVFERVRNLDRVRLVQAARLLSADQAFRAAVAARDKSSIASILVRYGAQVGAELSMLIRRDDVVAADTLGVGAGEAFFFPRLLREARAAGEASAMVVVRGRLYQLVVVPVALPGPFAWVAVGYAVDDALAREIGRLVGLEVSFASRLQRGEWKLQASTLDEQDRRALLREMATGALGADGGARQVGDALTRVLAVPAHTDDTVAVVLQQPLSAAMEPFRRLQRQLAWISLTAALVSIVASLLIARGIARPVRLLADFARRMAAGDFATVPPTPRDDEIGDLATAFRTMQQGLASREQRISNLAYRDTLTGLPNRTLFAERVDAALSAAADEPPHAAVLLLDIDRFKHVNETLGHAIGDLLLLEVAARLRRVVDRERDTVARLGGDEFALLLPGQGLPGAQRIAGAILRALDAPMTLEGDVVDVQASVGIAIAPDHGTERATLLRRADVAMYTAKRDNAGAVAWDDRYEQHGRERLSLMSDLRKAVDADELTLVYQPKIPLGFAAEHDVEALVRWRHPARGLVPPAEFIPFAEQTGCIRSITQWVLAHAFVQCAAWRRDGLAVNVSVNLSPRDLTDINLPERFETLLRTHGCRPQWIGLEITESAILDDPERAIENLRRLHAMGCRLAIDDYGTGYSSLAYLRRLPVDEIKIDKSFVMNMAHDAGNATIVRSTIDLAHDMGLAVVAEGVDALPVLERLRALGCDMVQGYFLSRPLPAADIEKWLRDRAESCVPAASKALRRVV
jgi:diguanylate cyclase (GGDEF)-like protein